MAVKAAKYSGAVLTDFAIASSTNVGEGLKPTHFFISTSYPELLFFPICQNITKCVDYLIIRLLKE